MLSRAQVLGRLFTDLDNVGPEHIGPVLVDVLHDGIGATAVGLLCADLESKMFRIWAAASVDGRPAVTEADISSPLYTRILREGTTIHLESEDHRVLVAPIQLHSNRIGVLEVRLGPTPPDSAREVVEAAGIALGYLITAADRWTDEFHKARRRKDMSLAAEMQYNLLPLGQFATDRVELASALEPAYEIGGDSFDYACGEQVLYAALIDAMGHGLPAARLSTLAINALRNSRRRGETLEQQARFVDETILPVHDSEGFVTATFLAIDLIYPGQSQIIVSGHPWPYLQRGTSIPQRITTEVDIPLGMPFEKHLKAQPLPLQSGDRLVLFSDGMVEAGPDGEEPFGHERLIQFIDEHRSLAPDHLAEDLIAEVLKYRDSELKDDATVLVIDIK